MKTSLFLAVLSILFLTACASDPSWPYVRPETSEETRRADFKSCDAWYGPTREITAHACMTKLGYSQTGWNR